GRRGSPRRSAARAGGRGARWGSGAGVREHARAGRAPLRRPVTPRAAAPCSSLAPPHTRALLPSPVSRPNTGTTGRCARARSPVRRVHPAGVRMTHRRDFLKTSATLAATLGVAGGWRAGPGASVAHAAPLEIPTEASIKELMMEALN